MRASKVDLLIAGVLALALASLWLSWETASPFPGYWEFGSFILIAVILDQTSLPLRLSASGSISFVMHMACAILFGGYWGGLAAGISVGLAQTWERVATRKIAFNVGQRVLSVTAAVLIYRTLGGHFPPAYLPSTEGGTLSLIQVDLALFFVFAAVYFAINSTAVSFAISLTSGRRFREVWSLNTRGVIWYDLGASILAMIVAWVFSKSQQSWGFGPYGLFFVIGPLIVVRHIYGLYHQLQHSGQELLQVMVKAIEARDPYTSGHSVRVSEFSRTIAVELGLSAKDVEAIETAALLHDVGKIHEEFAPLLRKEGRLTSEETALMQTHSTKSADLVGIISKFHGFIQDSVRHHHERWDGQGYPAGLAGKSIPLGSRIILISDTIDAMTTDRPYRKRLGLDIVIAELQKCKGTQFDPEIVDAVISSVAFRRVITEAARTDDSVLVSEPRSKRVSRPMASIWRVGRF